MDLEVVHRPERSRFEAQVQGQTAFLDYTLGDGEVVMPHTFVPPELAGRGIAGELTRTAVAWARAEQLTIDPQCPYVRDWLRRHG